MDDVVVGFVLGGITSDVLVVLLLGEVLSGCVLVVIGFLVAVVGVLLIVLATPLAVFVFGCCFGAVTLACLLVDFCDFCCCCCWASSLSCLICKRNNTLIGIT